MPHTDEITSVKSAKTPSLRGVDEKYMNVAPPQYPAKLARPLTMNNQRAACAGASVFSIEATVDLCFTRQLEGSELIPMATLQLGFARQQSRHLKPHLQQRVPVVRNDDGPVTG